MMRVATISFISALALSGCYMTKEKVYEKGDKAPLAGKWDCGVQFGKARKFELSEQSSGFLFFKNYTYVSNTGEETIAKKRSKDGTYVLQSREPGKSYTYSFVDFSAKDRMVVSVANMMHKGKTLEQIAGKHSVSSKRTGSPGTIELQGKPSQVAAFLDDHDAAVLSEIMECRKEG